MKAEHRKELETNVLADRVGRMIQSIKHRPQKSTLLWVVLIGGVVIGGWIFLRRGAIRGQENSLRWREFALSTQYYSAVHEQGRYDSGRLYKLFGDTNIARAANFNTNWDELWFNCLKSLGDTRLTRTGETVSSATFRYMEFVMEGEYESLHKKAKDDPVLAAEALYALAVIEETKALRDREHLKSALERYKGVAADHKDTAFGKRAAERVALLEDEVKYRDLAGFYKELQDKWNIREDKKLLLDHLK